MAIRIIVREDDAAMAANRRSMPIRGNGKTLMRCRLA